jgi:hypothetical protein
LHFKAALLSKWIAEKTPYICSTKCILFFEGIPFEALVEKVRDMQELFDRGYDDVQED